MLLSPVSLSPAGLVNGMDLTAVTIRGRTGATDSPSCACLRACVRAYVEVWTLCNYSNIQGPFVTTKLQLYSCFFRE
jgi:hypothetical protein